MDPPIIGLAGWAIFAMSGSELSELSESSAFGSSSYLRCAESLGGFWLKKRWIQGDFTKHNGDSMGLNPNHNGEFMGI